MIRTRLPSLLKAAVLCGLLPLLLTACASRSVPLKYAAHGDAYMIGFHDGRHSGLHAAGHGSALAIKDVTRFERDPAYRQGWLDGKEEGVRIQRESGRTPGTARRDSGANTPGPSAQPRDEALERGVLQPLDPSARLKF